MKRVKVCFIRRIGLCFGRPVASYAALQGMGIVSIGSPDSSELPMARIGGVCAANGRAPGARSRKAESRCCIGCLSGRPKIGRISIRMPDLNSTPIRERDELPIESICQKLEFKLERA